MINSAGISFIDIWRSEGGAGMKLFKSFDHVIGGMIARILPGAKVSTKDKRSIRRVLVIRPGGIGDAVFLLPVLRMLKVMGIQADILCERRNGEVFLSQPGLCGKIFRYDVLKEMIQVFGESYDAVVDTEQWHHLSAITAFFLRAPLRAGFATRPSRARLFHVRVEYCQNDHELLSFVRLFAFLGLKGPLQLEGSFKTDKVIGPVPPRKFVVLAMGGSIRLRRFTPEQARQIIQAVTAKGYDIALVGGKDVVSEHPMLHGSGVHDQCGKLSLLHTAALISRAEFFIGQDSGVAHLAVAVGTRTVIFFGPGNRKKWAPQGTRHTVLFNDVPCAPCTRYGYTIMTCRGKVHCRTSVADILKGIL